LIHVTPQKQRVQNVYGSDIANTFFYTKHIPLDVPIVN